MHLSIVIPLYNEEPIAPVLFERLRETLIGITDNFEIIFIDDGSTDNTLKALLDLKNKEKRIRVIELSRNFGHQAAYTAGLNQAKGQYVVMLDGDLQDPPGLISEMYAKITSDEFDIVFAQRVARGEKLLKRVVTKLFHWIFNRLSDMDITHDVGNFCIMNRNALNSLLELNERSRYLPGLVSSIGFKKGYVSYQRPERESGDTKMNFSRLMLLAFDAIFSFSKLPLKLSWIIGMIGILLSLTGAGVVIYKKIVGVAITGWTSTMLSIFFLGSVQLFFLGILGEYVFRIFIETKDRPIYIIRKLHE